MAIFHLHSGGRTSGVRALLYQKAAYPSPWHCLYLNAFNEVVTESKATDSAQEGIRDDSPTTPETDDQYMEFGSILNMSPGYLRSLQWLSHTRSTSSQATLAHPIWMRLEHS
jgi:hypothetical protein